VLAGTWAWLLNAVSTVQGPEMGPAGLEQPTI
jgi:hypothetical protein